MSTSQLHYRADSRFGSLSRIKDFNYHPIMSKKMIITMPGAKPPKTPLGKHGYLGSRCGLRVSPLAFGTMSIDEAYQSFLGAVNKEQAFELVDIYYKVGGNVIDTANNYQDEQSE
ncbi:hypothetical protein BZG36_05543 [Bifiguratus adelaidae]|uniref:NADP-dependent oxidoreductase domain-containing protein n=1 Tax=Bifiguratus adelaidae TaxID=1938954 RepID=A0A261XT95_9FUNG|nr:hypothetical protein BZG36_05543 [Bifiguratus adelaidae]